jgi:DNA-binding transcriptional MerR regulator
MSEQTHYTGGIQKPLKKLYYSLRQTAKMLEMRPEEIKKWEKHFPQIQPIRNKAGNRYYTERDVYMLLFLKEQLLTKKVSYQQASENLNRFKDELMKNENLKIRQTLAEIRLELAEIFEIINEPPAL